MGLEPWENEIGGNEGIVCYRHYDFLSKREQDLVNDRLRSDFSLYVSKNRRLPSKGKQQYLIKEMLSRCSVQFI